MNNIAELARDIQREKVARARKMSPTEKVLAGEELFHMAVKVTLTGIKAQHPEFNDAQALQMLRDRLALKARMEQSRVR